MAVFPALTQFNGKVIKKINDTNKESFSGNKPFITLTNFINGEETLYYKEYTKFNLSETDAKTANERFPAIITGLEVGTSGNLGTIRKAKVTIKFASMVQFKAHQNFFKIGHSQLVTWGWIGNSITNIDIPYEETARLIVNNIKNWQNEVGKHDNNMDFLAGILVNFDIKMNSDATVEVTLQLGAPSEIPGYLSLTRKDKTSSLDSEASTNSLTKICKALDLDGNLLGTSKDEIKANSINFFDWGSTAKAIGAYAAIPFGSTAAAAAGQKTIGSNNIGTTSQEYIQLGFAIKQICNHNIPVKGDEKTLELAIDLDNAVAMAHPNIISVSENVLFPNATTLGFFTQAVNEDGIRLIIPDTHNTQPFGPFNKVHQFPVQTVTKFTHQDGVQVKKIVENFYAGYIKNIYVSTQFLIDISKGVDTIFDFLQKLVDELNVAGAGLYNLIVKGDSSNKEGKEILSIEDLNFMADERGDELPELKLFTENSRIIELTLDSNLPKEMIGELMLSKDTTGALGSPGLKLFSSNVVDAILPKAEVGGGNIGQTFVQGVGDSVKPLPNTTGPLDTPLPSPGGTGTGGKNTTNKVEIGYLEGLWNFTKSQLSNYFDVGGPLRVKFANSKQFGDDGKNAMFGVYKDVSVVKTIYSGEKENIHRNALVPITIHMTILGLGGITIGTAVKLNPSPAPWLDGGFWQVTNVEHKIDSANWTTDIEFKYRVKY
jgi:hypothetical protein